MASKKRVAVIGGGCCGLISIKCCLDEGLEPVCYEITDHIGGLWYYTKDSTDGLACVMKSTVINTAKEMMPFSDFPIPKEYPNFMHNSKVYDYFNLYADTFGLKKHINFKKEVLSIKRAEDFDQTGKWVVRVKDVNSGSEVTEVFDAVLICTGHHADKHLPHFPGMENFKGNIVHTHDYKDHIGYEDKRVVVVGIGNSGGDVAVELGRVSKQVRKV